MKCVKTIQLSDVNAFLKLRKVFKTVCCDCGLTHTWTFETRAGTMGFRIDVDHRATGQNRKKVKG